VRYDATDRPDVIIARRASAATSVWQVPLKLNSLLKARLRAARLASDVAVLDERIPDDVLFAEPGGARASEAQDLAAHGSGIARFRAHVP